MGFPDGSVGKDSACNAGDPGSIPGSGRSTGEGKGYPLQYSWASLVAQLVKNPPARWETPVQSLGWEDPLEKGMATHFSILAWRILWTVWSMGLQRVRHGWVTFTFHFQGLQVILWAISHQLSCRDWNPHQGEEVNNADQTVDKTWAATILRPDLKKWKHTHPGTED